MTRVNWNDLGLLDPMQADQGAITATTETALWDPTQFSLIPANTMRSGRIYRVTAYGIMSFAATGSLTLTLRLGTALAGSTSLGSVPAAYTTPGVTSNAPWLLEALVVVKALSSEPNSWGTYGIGHFTTMPAAQATSNAAESFAFGGALGGGVVDNTADTGIFVGWTLSVAGSVTTHGVAMQVLS